MGKELPYTSTGSHFLNLKLDVKIGVASVTLNKSGDEQEVFFSYIRLDNDEAII